MSFDEKARGLTLRREREVTESEIAHLRSRLLDNSTTMTRRELSAFLLEEGRRIGADFIQERSHT